MIIRVSRASSGISDYLEKGKKQNSKYSRDEKDQRITLYGNLQVFKKTEQFLNENKNYKDNYLHITISYSRKDIAMMNNMSDIEKMNFKQNLINEVIKHHTSGYDMNNEVIAYCETHKPIIKFEDNKERLEHEHIVIALYNPLSDTKLRTTFSNNSYIDDVLQAYLNHKYNLTHPKNHERINPDRMNGSNIGRKRKHYLKELKGIKNREELLLYFKANNIQFKEVKTKNNEYYKIVSNNKKDKDINLRGKGFEHLENMKKDINYVHNKDKNINDLQNILKDYYKNRIAMIDKRRSVTSKEAIREIYRDIEDNKEHAIMSSLTYQQKIFYKHYNHLLDSDLTLKGYFIKTSDIESTQFINKQKNIKIEDKGDKIVSVVQDKDNLEERVNLMINIAVAKGWKLENIRATGSDEFRAEIEKQVAKRITAKKEQALKKINDNKIDTYTQTIKTQRSEEKQLNLANENLSDLKSSLDAKLVLDYCVKNYKLDANNYRLTLDNKIDNLSNKQKPKNIIDFVQKELNIPTSKAVEILQTIESNKLIYKVNSKLDNNKKVNINNTDDKQEETKKQNISIKSNLKL